MATHLMNDCMLLVTDLLAGIFDLADDLLYRTGVFPVLMSVIVISLTSRFILKPIFGSAGSDRAKKKKDKGE